MRGPKIWRAIASLENFCWGPRGPSRSHIWGIKMFIFYCNFSTKKTLVICNRWWVIILQFQGPLQAPLNPLKTDVSRGPPGLSGGPGPLGPHRNSTTGMDICYNSLGNNSHYLGHKLSHGFTWKITFVFCAHNILYCINRLLHISFVNVCIILWVCL